MRRLIALCLGFFVIVAFSGCATVLTSKVDLPNTPYDPSNPKTYINENPKGIRVYPTRVYLLVDADDNVKFEFWPDYAHAYDVKPIAIFGTNAFRIELENGQITTLSSNMDTTALIELVKELAKKAIELEGGMGSILKKEKKPIRIFRMDDNGIFRRVTLDLNENGRN